MGPRLRNLTVGFVAAAVAVVSVHQAIVWLLDASGLIERQAWSMAPVEPWGVPTLVNAMFWGGLWGAVMAALFDSLPGRTTLQKGLLFGWAIFAFANCLLIPLIKGSPLIYGFDLAKLLSVFLILSGFGIASALIYDWMRRSRTA